MPTTVIIGQGDVFGSDSPCVISTTLGSCVAVCLFDAVRRIGGMNHVVVPTRLLAAKRDTRGAKLAVTSLIERMLQLGGSLPDFRAKILGGAVPTWAGAGSPFAVGASNVEEVRLVLAHYGVPVVGEHIGGPDGRKIWFDTASGDVTIRPIRRLDEGPVATPPARS